MKKKTLKEAYYNELKKAGVIDTPKVKTLDEMTKKELIELALNNGLELDNKLTKAVMIEMINNHANSIETEEEKEKLPVDGTITTSEIETAGIVLKEF